MAQRWNFTLSIATCIVCGGLSIGLTFLQLILLLFSKYIAYFRVFLHITKNKNYCFSNIYLVCVVNIDFIVI